MVHEPARTCVGCRGEAGKGALIRIVRSAGGEASVDLSGHAPGRGAYLHSDPECIQSARRKRSLDRALRANIKPDLWAQIPSSRRGEG